jgi:hypothetical protein
MDGKKTWLKTHVWFDIKKAFVDGAAALMGLAE